MTPELAYCCGKNIIASTVENGKNHFSKVKTIFLSLG